MGEHCGEAWSGAMVANFGWHVCELSVELLVWCPETELLVWCPETGPTTNGKGMGDKACIGTFSMLWATREGDCLHP